MKLIDPELVRYAEQHTTEEPQLLKELVAHAGKNLEHIDMLSGRVVGQFLGIMVSISGARRVLEVGTFVGYSALHMAKALPNDGQLITCEYNKRYENIARSYFNRSKHGHKIKLVMGNALKTIPELHTKFDFVFLDADKVHYSKYYKLIISKMVEGGLLIIDNTFWSGTVLGPDDEKAQAIDRLNKIIKEDERVEQVMLTVRDGLMLVRKL